MAMQYPRCFCIYDFKRAPCDTIPVGVKNTGVDVKILPSLSISLPSTLLLHFMLSLRDLFHISSNRLLDQAFRKIGWFDATAFISIADF